MSTAEKQRFDRRQHMRELQRIQWEKKVSSGRYLPNGMLRVAVQRAVAERGWSWPDIEAESGLDHDTLRRSLGVGAYHRTRLVRYDRAVRVVRALGLDPVDFGV